MTGSQIHILFFFFSSRRRHTRCSRDWSSDVCSSDLFLAPQISQKVRRNRPVRRNQLRSIFPSQLPPHVCVQGLIKRPQLLPRSEERRVGKECRSRWSPYH